MEHLAKHPAQVLEKRADMKCIIASATLDTEKFAAYFDGAPLLQVIQSSFWLGTATSRGPRCTDPEDAARRTQVVRASARQVVTRSIRAAYF